MVSKGLSLFKRPIEAGKWRYCVSLLILMALILCAPSVSFAAGGNPSRASDGYYLIEDAQDLAWIANNLSANVRLANDIDLNSSPWTPIGTVASGNGESAVVTAGYTGTFDGAGYTIKNLYIDNRNGNATGLFGAIGSGAKVSDLAIEVDYIYGSSDHVGALAGYSAGTIERIKVKGIDADSEIVGNDSFIGGIIGASAGQIWRSQVSDIKVRSTTTANWEYGYYVGGIAGSSYNSIMRSSTNNVAIQGNLYTGGITGRITSGKIDLCLVTRSEDSNVIIFGRRYVGGIVGENLVMVTTVKNDVPVQYTNNILLNTACLGGIAGYNNGSDAKIVNAINTGSVQRVARNHGKTMGGIAGYNEDGVIAFCTNTGAVGPFTYVRPVVAGIVGENSKKGKVYACLNTGAVNGYALCSYNYGYVMRSGWLQNTGRTDTATPNYDIIANEFHLYKVARITQAELDEGRGVLSLFPEEFDYIIDGDANKTVTITFSNPVGNLSKAMEFEHGPTLSLTSASRFDVVKGEDNVSFTATATKNGRSTVSFYAHVVNYLFDDKIWTNDADGSGSSDYMNVYIDLPFTVTNITEENTGEGDTGEGDTGEGDTGEGDTGEGDTGEGDTGEGDTGEGDTGEGDTGEGDTGEGDTGEGDTGEGDTGEGDTGESGDTDTGTDDTDTVTESESSSSNGCNTAGVGILSLLAAVPFALRRRK